MSNTVYIDVNTKNSVNVNATNNKFEYRLPNVMDLPTGTEIGLQSSIVNLKGINGASVEINEDIEETIVYQYYALDTTYDNPVNAVAQASVANLIEYNLIVDLAHKFNLDKEFPGITGVITEDMNNNLSHCGFSENIMPLVGQIICPDGTKVAVPMTGKSRIFIKKGIYAIEKLAAKITEQINLNRTINEDTDDDANTDFYDQQKNAGTWGGMFVNNSTCRNFPTQSDPWSAVAAGTRSPDDASFYQFLPFSMLGALDSTQVNPSTNFNKARLGLCDVIAVTPATNEQIRGNAARGGFGAAFKSAGPVTFAELCPTSSTNARYFMGFENATQYDNSGTGGDTPESIFSDFNPFYNGIAFGTTGFEVKYDTNNSGYSLSKLHEPRRIPTIDRFGTTMSSAGQECVFNKVPTETAEATLGDTVTKGLTAIMSRMSGILVTNWALDTSKRLGDAVTTYANPNLTAEQQSKCDEYNLYSQFFSTPEKAQQAWDTTIWSRLGFQYDEIQDNLKDGAGQTFANWYGTNQFYQGFTTDQSRDQTILPQISNLFNPLSETAAAAIPKPATPAQGTIYRGALPAVSNVQFFNMLGNSRPQENFTNNLALVSKVNVAGFQGSFYKQAIMTPVVTTAKDFTAKKLPTLSSNGYMVITSDLVEPVDVLKNQQNSGILDIIPKSNLSNQDYIADRNVLTHTLSNPKQVNSISMSILNPDMTDIDLEPDSSFLFRIAIPIPKPTNFLAQTAQEAKAQQVSGALSSIIQKSTDQGKQGTNLRMDVSNILGDSGGGSGIPDEDLNDIEAVLDAQAGLGVPTLQQEPFERDLNYTQPERFDPSLPPIEEALLEPVEGASGSVGISPEARERERQRVDASRQGQRGRFGANPARQAASAMRPDISRQLRSQNPLIQREAQERELGEVLTNLEQQLAVSEERLRDPRIKAGQYQQILNRRNQIEQTIQQLSARGIQGVADPSPQQLQQAAQQTQPPQPPQDPE